MAGRQNSEHRFYKPYDSRLASTIPQPYLANQYSSSQHPQDSVIRQYENTIYSRDESYSIQRHYEQNGRSRENGYAQAQDQTQLADLSSNHGPPRSRYDNSTYAASLPYDDGRVINQWEEGGRSKYVDNSYSDNLYASRNNDNLAPLDRGAEQAAVLLDCRAYGRSNLDNNSQMLTEELHGFSLSSPLTGHGAKVRRRDRSRPGSIAPTPKYNQTYSPFGDGDSGLPSRGNSVPLSFSSMPYSSLGSISSPPNIHTPYDYISDADASAVPYGPPENTHDQKQADKEFTEAEIAHLKSIYQPMECQMAPCQGNFIYKTFKDYNNHIRNVHQKRYTCPFVPCGKKFSRKSDSKKHILTHLGIKPFSCPDQACDRRVNEFSRKDKLDEHKKKWHRN